MCDGIGRVKYVCKYPKHWVEVKRCPCCNGFGQVEKGKQYDLIMTR